MSAPEPLTAAELAELERLCAERAEALRERDSDEPARATDAILWLVNEDLAAKVPRLLAALRDRLRWRTVSADGLPENNGWVVMRHVHDGPYLGRYDATTGCWALDNGMKAEPRDTDRWWPLPPVESE